MYFTRQVDFIRTVCVDNELCLRTKQIKNGKEKKGKRKNEKRERKKNQMPLYRPFVHRLDNINQPLIIFQYPFKLMKYKMD